MTSPAQLLDLADHCVKCGLCVPHCPTYGLSRDENESPRGRIALIQGIAEGRLSNDPGRAWRHIERCLGCRACEAACPSGVAYGRLLDGARALAVARQGWLSSVPGGLALASLARVPTWPVTRRFLRALQRIGLVELAGRVAPTPLARIIGLLPPLGPGERWRSRYPAPGAERTRVALFLGCVGRVVEQDSLRAAIRVLNLLGAAVEVPRGQVCCGAMHEHAGRAGRADRLAAMNRRAFANLRAQAVVSVASACAAQLAEHGQTPEDPGPPNPIEICSYLARLAWPEDLKLAQMPGRALVHEPCSLRHPLDGAASAYHLLTRIPGLDVAPLPGNDRCCGAAGTYVLTQPKSADRLVEPKIRSLAALKPRWLLTSNTGCALHLRAAANRAGIDVEVLHPVQLLDRALSHQPI